MVQSAAPVTAQLAWAFRTRVIGRVKRVDLRDLFGTEKCGQPHHRSRLSVRITDARWRQVGVGHGSSALRRSRHCSDVSLLDARRVL